ncbi:MAG: arylesterase [Phyllobacteriaceae bacterium]|nr:arylesterase [Phyllobacteriaceae bacterium]MBA90816.1 arylesterase [Phyllobacteriaceae bacterium]
MLFKGWLRIVALLGSVLLSGIGHAQAEPFRIIGFGDSLMAGYQLGPGEGFTGQLEAALRKAGHDVTVANAGVSGDTTSGGLSRLDWSVPDDADLVILELGANDALRGIDPALTRSNLDAMISRLKERGIAVLLAGMLAPPNMGDAYAGQFNAIYPDLAKEHGIILHPFFLDGVAARQDLLLEDGMHPNPQGVAVMVGNIMPAVEAAMADHPRNKESSSN